MPSLFSYPIVLDELTTSQKKYEIAAQKDQFAELATVLQVPAVKKLSGTICLKTDKKNALLYVKGNVKACLTLKSVISLELFDQQYNADFELAYSTCAKTVNGKETELDFEEEPMEEIKNGTIDLADVLIEQIALLIEDNPRQNGETFCFEAGFDATEKENPFAVLSKWKKKC